MSKHDRSKSGSILDTLFFSRPHKKSGRGNNYGSQSINGGRPVSAEADAASFENLQIEVKLLTLEEVNQKFSEILEDMNIPADKREPLLLKKVDEKKEMILMHLKGKKLIEIFITIPLFLVKTRWNHKNLQKKYIKNRENWFFDGRIIYSFVSFFYCM